MKNHSMADVIKHVLTSVQQLDQEIRKAHQRCDILTQTLHDMNDKLVVDRSVWEKTLKKHLEKTKNP